MTHRREGVTAKRGGSCVSMLPTSVEGVDRAAVAIAVPVSGAFTAEF